MLGNPKMAWHSPSFNVKQFQHSNVGCWLPMSTGWLLRLVTQWGKLYIDHTKWSEPGRSKVPLLEMKWPCTVLWPCTVFGHALYSNFIYLFSIHIFYTVFVSSNLSCKSLVCFAKRFAKNLFDWYFFGVALKKSVLVDDGMVTGLFPSRSFPRRFFPRRLG